MLVATILPVLLVCAPVLFVNPVLLEVFVLFVPDVFTSAPWVFLEVLVLRDPGGSSWSINHAVTFVNCVAYDVVVDHAVFVLTAGNAVFLAVFVE